MTSNSVCLSGGAKRRSSKKSSKRSSKRRHSKRSSTRRMRGGSNIPSGHGYENETVRIINMYKMIDTDGSGSVSTTELKTYLMGLGKLSEEQVNQIVTSADHNNDGNISLPEFTRAARIHKL